MVLRAVVSLKGELQDRLFEAFGKRLLVECIPHVEDNIKVVVCELIADFLPYYLPSQELVT